ncbi:aryl-sulfate sulfotransferase [Sutterella seckii]|uniref:Aryl-sulfate sulfotransferase n=3 Tax=Sutterella TaxID=40544 RepID=A0A6I1EKH5_9BURK|nr:aryl-sulfate sulfotransferase [Sutterella seckii]KAB7660617.1 aryl-sulfate sulfotransferase [Sutterella seckii]
MSRLLKASLAAAALIPAAVMAMGGASGPKTTYEVQGHLGEIVVNPYEVAPLTAIIRNGGYQILDARVTVLPKPEGEEISYNVSRRMLLTHGGIPVFGLYPDYLNSVKVEYTRLFNGKTEKFSDIYKIYGSPIYVEASGLVNERSTMPKVRAVKVDPKFKDRLYLLNNAQDLAGKASHAVWNNPMGGALEWNFNPQIGIVDTKGDYRWYLFTNPIYSLDSLYYGGDMMGFRQNKDGAFTWGYGQRYVKYDLMGREIWNRRLPISYNDFSHSLDPAQNGHFFLRVASSNVKLANGQNVRTVRDVIAEVDHDGYVVDEFRLFDILDPYRSDVIKALDQGAVCLNIDASKAGKTLSEEDIRKLNESDHYGDIAGTGIGRNWAHVNSVDYDPTDDSIIISSRHQSAIIKIGRDKKVKWILGAPRGWKGEFAGKVLKPVDHQGKPIACTDATCEGGFDWTWTQHTAFRIDAKSKPGVVYLTAFDNGDARGMEQPALPEMKYSRAVVYKVDEKAGTVEQVWTFGEERGHDWFSPVTSLTEYHADKNSIFVYSATAGAPFDIKTGAFTSAPNPYMMEFNWGEKEPAVEMRVESTTGYQAMPIDLKAAFEK